MFYPLIRKALFATDPEIAHGLSLESIQVAYRTGATRLMCNAPASPVQCMGLEFPNPVGIAPGLDKNGDYFNALGDLGFGFVEIGTVTPRPQPGNPKPRVFRLTQAQAMINRLGFNNKGVDHLVRQVSKRRYKGVLGINIGKNFDTPIENAADDYLLCLEKVYPLADYITVNISSPNTKNLRDLQGAEELNGLLAAVATRRSQLADQHGQRKPIAVKIAPDIEDDAIPVTAEIIAEHGMDAVIATNTTIARPGVGGLPHANEAGGLSGAPLKARSDEVLALVRASLPGHIDLIGVGGITSGQDAVDKLQRGATLVQFYTGMVYRGPDLLTDCLRSIADMNVK